MSGEPPVVSPIVAEFLALPEPGTPPKPEPGPKLQPIPGLGFI